MTRMYRLALGFLVLGLLIPFSFAKNGFGEEMPKLSLHPNGPIGLFHTISAEVQPHGPFSLATSLTTTYFNIKSLPAAGVRTERLTGKLALSYTPLKYVEFFLAGSTLTSNDDNNAQLISQIGNLDFGAKFGKQVGKIVWIGTSALGYYQRAVADLDFTNNTVSVDGLALATFDLVPAGIPMRIHANVGYRWDRTDRLVAATTTERDRIILGVVGPNAILGAIGFEFPYRAVTFNLEYSTEQTLNTAGVGYMGNPQRITTGIRYFPMSNRRLALEVAGDIGMFATRSASRVVKEPKWNVIAGLTYRFGPGSVKDAGPSVETGTVLGQVKDAKTEKGVGGAQIQFCDETVGPLTSDAETGNYRSYPLPQGPCEIKVTHENYESFATTVDVVRNAETTQDLALAKKVTKQGMIVLAVKDDAGKPIPAQISLPELPQARLVETNSQGKVRIRLPVGTFLLQAQAAGKKPSSQRIEVVGDRETFGEFVLEPAKAQLEDRAIAIYDQILFLPGKAIISEPSKEVLDQVAEILVENPTVKKIEVGGHADATGNPAFNKTLSQKRAEAVKKYLVAVGVEESRLTAVGYGQDLPIADNQTAEGRAKNRRVEFKIVDK